MSNLEQRVSRIEKEIFPVWTEADHRAYASSLLTSIFGGVVLFTWIVQNVLEKQDIIRNDFFN